MCTLTWFVSHQLDSPSSPSSPLLILLVVGGMLSVDQLEFVVEPVSDTDPEWGSSCCYLVLLRFNKKEKNNGISVVIRLHHLRKRSESFFLSLFFSLLLLFFLNSSSYSKRLGKSDNEHCTLPRRLQTGVSILWLRSELHSRLPCVRPCSLAENCSPNCICAHLLWYRENDTFGRRCNVLWDQSLCTASDGTFVFYPFRYVSLFSRGYNGQFLKSD